jgi:pimeloyl-ACP methyl ester carboxylesterase
VRLTDGFVEIRLDRAADLRARRTSRRRLAEGLLRLVPEFQPVSYGLLARPSYRPNDASRPTICLVHGLDATARIWEKMIEPLEEAGFGVVLFQFPNDQAIDKSARQLAADVAHFRRERSDQRRWHLVTHSMGGLVARSYVENPDLYARDVDRLIMLSPPNHGSNLAAGRFFVEWVTHAREKHEEDHSLWTMLTDGLGEAGEDLRPDSLFLAQLNGRARNPSVRYSIVAGTKAFLVRQLRDQVVEQLEELQPRHPVLARLRDQARSALDVELVPELIDGHGDGAVSIESARLEGVRDFEELRFDHLSMLGVGPFAEPGAPPCLEPVLRRLRADQNASSEHAQTKSSQ